MLTLHADVTQILRAKRLLSHIPKGLQQALKYAGKRTLEMMRTDAVQLVTQEYVIKPGKVRKTITLRANQMGGMFMSRGRRVNLSDFRISPKKIPVKHGLQAQVKHEGGMKSIPRGFLIPGRNSGKLLAFQRVGRGRMAIEALISPAVPQMLDNPDVKEGLLSEAEKNFDARLRYEVMRQLGIYS